ncbi:TetR family transcriptional regulator [Rhodococcoides fascians A21d2]|uniref:TetR/AcrR family transcriptional regulator n=1 Tax=Nocardiaceae TaxID=85025 RepID=UPI000561438E|nr:MULTISPECIES: TetR/AcrR family transcriptional regulator [Rhodococcus]OZC51554.1 TetR family transcriptional regulator [Rhodococcus sp. WWJCD1]QIH99851.1 TetR family transcriptional regulator [Rhodococcus fascians A21d2]
MPSAKADRPEPTFIQNARREQLIECAVDVIAEAGVEKASFVRIAERAGISRGVISYHFGSREELLDGVVRLVYALGEAEVGPLVRAAGSSREALLQFISGSVAFYGAYPRHMKALSAIFAAVPVRGERAEHGAEMLEVHALLEEGQRSGEFRRFDTRIMVMTIRAALDAAVWRVGAGDDAEVLADELRRTFDAATRSDDR